MSSGRANDARSTGSHPKPLVSRSGLTVVEPARRPDDPGEDQASDKACIARSALFAGVGDPAIELVLASAVRRSVPARSVLFRQGDPAEYLYLLVKGHVKVGHVDPGGNPLMVRFMHPGDLIGCPFCRHVDPVRDFLSLATPTRPARVEIRVVVR